MAALGSARGTSTALRGALRRSLALGAAGAALPHRTRTTAAAPPRPISRFWPIRLPRRLPVRASALAQSPSAHSPSLHAHLRVSHAVFCMAARGYACTNIPPRHGRFHHLSLAARFPVSFGANFSNCRGAPQLFSHHLSPSPYLYSQRLLQGEPDAVRLRRSRGQAGDTAAKAAAIVRAGHTRASE